MKMHEAQLGNQVDVQAVPVQDKRYLKNDEQVEKKPNKVCRSYSRILLVPLQYPNIIYTPQRCYDV